LAELDYALKLGFDDGKEERKLNESHFGSPRNDEHNDLRDSKIIDFRFDDEYYS
jgi:hypothetical protein